MRPFSIAVLAFSALAVAACGSGAERAGPYRGRLLDQPLTKTDFTLADTQGQPFDFRERTDGFVTLLFFGYTNCPDVCPIHMANIAAVLDDFPLALRRQFKVVFVTTDPERDTPERLRSWLDNFDPTFIGLRGGQEEVAEVQRALGLPPATRQEAGGHDYSVGHAASVIAFTKDDSAHLVYPFGTRQADWALDLPRLAEESWALR